MPSVEVAPHQLPPGTVIAGKYRVESQIAEGGMGVVLLATQLDLERRVAIKVVRAELASDPVVVERLLMEAKSAAQIRGEHVARVLDTGRLEDGTPFLVMDHLEGRNLASLLETRDPFPIEEAVEIILQACHALAEVHRAGILHRDLKPENLFMAIEPDGSSIVKVLDFGISKRITGPGPRRTLTTQGLLVGSPYYMAPEQLAGASDLDARADVWALGVILYELLSGRQPFDEGSIQDVCIAIVQREPEPLERVVPGLPLDLARAVAKCLAKERSERWAGVDELARAISPFGDDSAALLAERVSRIARGSTLRPERVSDGHRASAISLEPTVATSQPTPVVRRRRPAIWVGMGSTSLVLFVVGFQAGTATWPRIESAVAAARTAELPAHDDLVLRAKERSVLAGLELRGAIRPIEPVLAPSRPAPAKSAPGVLRRRGPAPAPSARDGSADEARAELGLALKDPWERSK